MEDYREMDACTICPRACKVNRNNGQTGYCRVSSELLVSRAALHLWEEPCISGEKGSGTVFFSGCNMGCVFCQNHVIARGQTGRKISVERLSEIFLELQRAGASNVNLVTPSHYVPQIIHGIKRAKDKGLNLPIVYNSSGYEKAETIKSLEGLVDVYLPDFKYLDEKAAKNYSNCPDYAVYAKASLKEMVRQTGKAQFDSNGMMVKGTIVRHLSLPGLLSDSKDILTYLSDTYGKDIYISIMNQYTPVITLEKFPDLNRKVTLSEYDELIMFARLLGIKNAYIQEDETQVESFIPSFNGEGV